MNDVAPSDIALPAPSRAQAEPASAPPARARRGRLFRKYLLLILTLVTIALLASGAIGIYFSYQENRAALGSVQHEKALAAASRIEQYVDQVAQQLAFAALPQLDPNDVELRRVEFLKLLRQAPIVTDVAQIDPSGRERVAVSRLGMDSVNSGRDRSSEDAFIHARPGRPWFGPVYFHKETEPYMTIAVRNGGEKGPVTAADVNLKFIWDVVSRIRIGAKGKAYVVDDNGYLVADPDIGLVLRKTNLSSLPHVRAAISSAQGDAEAMVSTDLAGTRVLTSVAPIESLKWNVFVEQPVSEVYAKLNASIVRTALLLLAGLGLSALGALALARGMVRPIRVLEEGAQRIGAGDLDQRIDIRTGDELEALAGQFNRMTGALRESYAGLEQKVEARTHELQNALEQQTAISEILRVISSSPTDVKPVLDAVAQRAARLCEATVASVLLRADDVLRPMSAYSADGGSAPSYDYVIPLRRSYVTGRAALDRATVAMADVEPLLDDEFPDARENQQALGFRAVLAVPLVREEVAYGVIYLYRREARAFSVEQVALVETFARQAAIAIDNVRLFNETKEALERQTAMAEILQVISSSPGDVKPMLHAVARRALKLCDAAQAGIFLVEGDAMRYAAGYGDMLRPDDDSMYPLTRGLVIGRAAIDRQTFHVPDIVPLIDTEYPEARATQQQYGFRALLAVPLCREDRAIGAIALWRREPRDFSDQQIALVKTFADQAVIAIENVRLFNETKEALERQTAMAEILRVISGSPTDVQPVFDTIATAALGLCDAVSALVFTYDGALIHLAANANVNREDEQTWRSAFPRPPSRETAAARAILTADVVMIPDVLDDPEYVISTTAISTGFRSCMAVPLMRDGQPIGALGVGRPQPGPFGQNEIAILQTFADQAVIAIENVRLFNETKEALEQQTAVAEILRVISSSPTDVQPVLDAIAERAARLCEASAASIYLLDGTALRHLASRGPSPDPVDHVEKLRVDRDSITGRAFLECRPIQVDDMLAEGAEYPVSLALARKFDHRAVLVMPLLREGQPFGTILLRRREVQPFGERERMLLRTFGDQAAIALENVRLFNETKEALDQQRASGEVLATISSSIADTAPVFDRILESCERLFAGRLVQINLVGEDGLVRIGAFHGPVSEDVQRIFPFPVDASSATGLSIVTRAVVHYPDVDGDAVNVPPRARTGWQALGIKAAIGAPMLWEGRGIGTILVGREHAGAFSEKEIALLKTFADQAVIAIQNARLFNETKEALDQQRASGEVLAAISNSIADTGPVFEKILSSAERLFAGNVIAINLVGDDGRIRVAAYRGPNREALERAAFEQRDDASSGTGLAIARREVLHFADVANDPNVPSGMRRGAAVSNVRAAMTAPMLWEGKGLGAIVVGRAHAGAFSGKEIALLKTFADQAVIAIQNARLFHEIEDKSRQLEIANKHKSEFLANMSHELRTPLNAIIGFSEVLLERLFGDLNVKQDDYLKDIHSSGKHLLSLINDILDLSKIEAGRMELEPSRVDVDTAIANALTLIRERAQAHGIALAKDVDASLGTIVADERKFKQILLNLLSNAVKFTPDGGRIEVNARRVDGAAQIAVSDTGIGIAPEDRAAVFEEFRQVGRDYTKKQEGTGLGLALTRKFVELHGGRIWLESTPGRGSTFTFTIPLRP
jgi:GAF domain-containing protein/HAMP domain-containing protein